MVWTQRVKMLYNSHKTVCDWMNVFFSGTDNQLTRVILNTTTTTTFVALNHTCNRLRLSAIMSGTTEVSHHQKKHSPTHTYRGHQSSLTHFLHLPWCMASSLFYLRACQSFFHNLQVFFALPVGLAPSTSNSIHFFTQSFFFLQHIPIPSQRVLLYYQDYVI